MRATLSRRILNSLEHHTPGWIRSMQAQILLDLASRSMDLPGKKIRHLAPDQALKAYAEYTAEGMRQTHVSPERLYQNAYELGTRVRRITGLTDSRDLQRLIFYLYSNIRITMKGCLPGTITVPVCYFSSLYTPEECRLMSCVDSGVIAGLFQGGELNFSQRITEGCGQCTACFAKERKPHDQY